MQSLFATRRSQALPPCFVVSLDAQQALTRRFCSRLSPVHCSARRPVPRCLDATRARRERASHSSSRRLCLSGKNIRWTGRGCRYYATAAVNAAPDPEENFLRVNFPTANAPAPGVKNRRSVNVSPVSSTKGEVDQKELYNYAARFLCVPKVHFGWKGPRKHSGYKVCIELEEQKITAQADGSSVESAFLGAMEDFKRQAHAYCASNESAASLMSSTSLTTETANEFLVFYRLKNRGEVVGVREEDELSPRWRGKLFKATPTLDDKPLSQPLWCRYKAAAAVNAKLVAAIVLRQRQPQLWPEFLEELKKGSGRIIRPVKPTVPFPVNKDCLLAMRDTMQGVERAGLDNKQGVPELDPGAEQQIRQRRRFKMAPGFEKRRNLELQDQLRQLQSDPDKEDVRAKVRALPANQSREEILEIINNNVYSIVVGATGSGKTTQVPQLVFNQAIEEGRGATCNIITTQPRRIAATSVAARVASERDRRIRDTVGYNIRFDCKAPYLTGGITYSTTGTLLTQLQWDRDELLNSISHLIIDEVHERDLDLDFLLITVKKAIEERLDAGKRVPKVVFMSATLDTALFSSYFQNKSWTGASVPCPHINVPGRTYPVREHYLDDVMDLLHHHCGGSTLPLRDLLAESMTTRYLLAEEANDRKKSEIVNSHAIGERETTSVDWGNLHKPLLAPEAEESVHGQYEDPEVPVGLAAATIAYIAKTTFDGAVVAFLPGYDSIKKLETMLTMDRPLGVDFTDERKFKIIKLHSSIEATQTEVFNDVPEGCRKIILSTNIAETSVTIPDIRHVVDTGKVNQQVYNPQRRISKLACCWISKSSARQRAGRAGRVQDGSYYALFSRGRFDSLRTDGMSEIQRLDLQEVCLRVKAGGFSEDVRGFLGQAIEPPSPAPISSSMEKLISVGALDPQENITPLGRLLSRLPLGPALGKMVVLGTIFRCLDPILILAAAESEMSLFVRPFPETRQHANQVRSQMGGNSQSDHLATLNAFYALRRNWNEDGPSAAHAYAVAHHLSSRAFRNLQRCATQIETILSEAGLIPTPVGDPGSFRIRSQFGGPELNVNSSRERLVKAIMLNALFPNLAVKNLDSAMGWRTEREAQAMLSARSLHTINKDEETKRRGALVSFSSMSEGSSPNEPLTLINSTRVLPLMVCLFGGRLTRRGPLLVIDDWLPFHVYIEEKPDAAGNLAADMVTRFRQILDRILSKVLYDLIKFGDMQESQSLVYGDKSRRYLADDSIRDLFTAGLDKALSASPSSLQPIPYVSERARQSRALQGLDHEEGKERKEGDAREKAEKSRGR